MYKGGYLIVDLEGKDLSQSMVYEGIYDRIESTRKAILVTRFVRSGVEYHDFMLPVSVVGSNYVGVVRFGDNWFKITIDDRDIVSVTVEAYDK